ncbi:hypothetical protein V9T40_012679 [Parthenolecanium corni]|uniref:Uncharacterized protein n=1 Tax=Parthenolecanium corni TaxID=536013 RepID=A0AAN9Y0S9_9HEMI
MDSNGVKTIKFADSDDSDCSHEPSIGSQDDLTNSSDYECYFERDTVGERVAQVMGDAVRMQQLAHEFLEEGTNLLLSNTTSTQMLKAAQMMDEAKNLMVLTGKEKKQTKAEAIAAAAAAASSLPNDAPFKELSDLDQGRAYPITNAYRTTQIFPNLDQTPHTYQVIEFQDDKKKYCVIVPQSVRPYPTKRREEFPEPGEIQPIHLPFAYFMTYNDNYMHYMC